MKLDRIIKGGNVVTPAGSFTGCVQIDETTPLEPDDLSIKRYCPGVGLVYDDGIRLVDWSEAFSGTPASDAPRGPEPWREWP